MYILEVSKYLLRHFLAWQRTNSNIAWKGNRTPTPTIPQALAPSGGCRNKYLKASCPETKALSSVQ